MSLMAHRRSRRWLGVLLLGAAIGMLLAGETVLKEHLSEVGFLLFWLGCLALTIAAVVVAVLDARAVARGTLQEQRNLFQATLGHIAEDANAKVRAKSGGPVYGRTPGKSSSDKPGFGSPPSSNANAP